ncbi:helix-turn-helix domain-containing protein [Herbidospora daliensis]|uniref:helix-turn-helix domain-containing protein n=1 Tax=Herbidospora daliensis TaxID=295585 RepID=UPI0007802337|nr:helix-turn-helix domain-containing protein [Herbidospora daliensis]
MDGRAFLASLRTTAVTRVEAGERVAQVSRNMGVSRSSVYEWLRQARSGPEKLQASPLQGRPSALSPDGLHDLAVALLAGPESAGLTGRLWTRELVNELVSRDHGVSLTLTSIGRLLRSLGLWPRHSLVTWPDGSARLWKQRYAYIKEKAREQDALLMRGGLVDVGALLPRSSVPAAPFGFHLAYALIPGGPLLFRAYSGPASAATFLDFAAGLVAETGRATCLITAGHPVFELDECARGLATLPLTVWVRGGGDAREVRPAPAPATASAPDLRPAVLGGPSGGLWTMERLAHRLGALFGHPVSTGDAEVLLSAQNLWPEGPLPPALPPSSPAVGRWCHDVLPLFQADAGPDAVVRFVQEVPLPGGRTLLLAVSPAGERRFAWYEEARYQGRMRATTLADFTRRLRHDVEEPLCLVVTDDSGWRSRDLDATATTVGDAFYCTWADGCGERVWRVPERDPVQALCRRHFHLGRGPAPDATASLEMEHPPRGPIGTADRQVRIAAARERARKQPLSAGGRLRELVLAGPPALLTMRTLTALLSRAYGRPVDADRAVAVLREEGLWPEDFPSVEPGPWEHETLPLHLAHAGAGAAVRFVAEARLGGDLSLLVALDRAGETRFAWYPQARYRGRMRATTLVSFAELLLDETGGPLCLVAGDEGGWKSKELAAALARRPVLVVAAGVPYLCVWPTGCGNRAVMGDQCRTHARRSRRLAVHGARSGHLLDAVRAASAELAVAHAASDAAQEALRAALTALRAAGARDAALVAAWTGLPEHEIPFESEPLDRELVEALRACVRTGVTSLAVLMRVSGLPEGRVRALRREVRLRARAQEAASLARIAASAAALRARREEHGDAVRRAWREGHRTVTTMCEVARISPYTLARILEGLGADLLLPPRAPAGGALAEVARAAVRLGAARTARDDEVRAALGAGVNVVGLLAETGGMTQARVRRLRPDPTRETALAALAASRAELDRRTAGLARACRPLLDQVAGRLRAVAEAAHAEALATVARDAAVRAAWAGGVGDPAVLAVCAGTDSRTVTALVGAAAAAAAPGACGHTRT